MISLMGGSSKSFLPEGNFKKFLFVFVIFFIKVYLVQFSYNLVAPKLISDFGNKVDNNQKQFEPMSFTQAIFLVILANNLFR
jgi:hypothetical protein